MSKRDYYEVLGVTRAVTEAELKSAYRRLAMQHHPDRNPGDKKAEENFKEAAEAYAVLADASKRAAYDRFGHAGVGAAAGAGAGFDPETFGDFADILGNMFGFGDLFGGRRRGGPQRGSDLRYDLEISFLESASAPSRRSDSTSGDLRDLQRHGSGGRLIALASARCVAAGPADGSRVLHDRGHLSAVPRRRRTICQAVPGMQRRRPRDAGAQDQGESRAGSPTASSSGCRTKTRRALAAPGHNLVVVHVQEHSSSAAKAIISSRRPVNFTTLALGGDRRPTSMARRMKMPRRHADRDDACGCGKGCPTSNGRGRGDLLVTVQVQTPKSSPGNSVNSSSSSPRYCRRRSSSLAPQARREGSQPLRPCKRHVRVVLYPAVSITGADSELVLAVADDYSPTAAEHSGNSLTVFLS